MFRKSPVVILQNNTHYLVAFFFLFFVDAVLTPMSLIVARFYPIFYHFFKLPFLGITGLGGLYFICNRYKLGSLVKVYLFFGSIALIQGLYFHRFDRIFVSHLYGALVPIFGFYFGANVFRNLDTAAYAKIEEVFVYCFYVLVAIVVAYYGLLKIGFIEYYGISTVLPIFMAFFAAKRKYALLVLSVVAIMLSGKRVALVEALVLGLPFLVMWGRTYFLGKKIDKKFFVQNIIIVLALYGFISVFRDLEMLRRVTSIFNNDWNTAEGLYRATGGRSLEIQYGIMNLMESPLSWLFGGGFGHYFWEPLGINESDSFWRMHYSHFSPLYITLVYGLPCCLIIYFINFRIFFKSLFNKFSSENFYLLCFLIYFASSFFGSVMFIDFKYWFFAGAASYFLKEKGGQSV